jgi:Protein of unknown function (DUF3048) N-terminal domain/Protein of unknown function (DUF3048) C-terminal domain
MRKTILITILSLTLACIIPGGGQPVPEPDLRPTVPLSPIPSATVAPTQPNTYTTPTPGYPEAGFGPDHFPVDINPLTGLSTEPAVLDRRPMLIKVSNLPREVRPQSGLSRADIVFEYYTEEGTTRFIAIYYGKDAAQVGSIRSARFFDEHIIRMYRGFFVFGSGDERVRERLYGSDFADRLILEWQAGCPALCRPDPLTNYLMADTLAIRKYIQTQGIPDERQGLEGMRFRLQPPDGGQAVNRVYAWYSAVIYNRWDFDPPSGRYYRYVDVENALDGQPEVYKPLRDALGNVPISADNVVVLLVPHDFYSISPEIVEIQLYATGPAYAFRNGQAYELEWARPDENGVLHLLTKDGEAFPLKPGVTWFEVMGISTKFYPDEESWRFEMRFP